MEVRSSLSEVTFSFITSAEVKERAKSIAAVHCVSGVERAREKD
jgi:hypothetical protein